MKIKESTFKKKQFKDLGVGDVFLCPSDSDWYLIAKDDENIECYLNLNSHEIYTFETFYETDVVTWANTEYTKVATPNKVVVKLS